MFNGRLDSAQLAWGRIARNKIRRNRRMVSAFAAGSARTGKARTEYPLFRGVGKRFSRPGRTYFLRRQSIGVTRGRRLRARARDQPAPSWPDILGAEVVPLAGLATRPI